MKYKLTLEASFDLEGILTFTLESWGIDLVDKYYTKLLNNLERISENPQIGSRYLYIDSDIRKLPFESHVIFYEIKDAFISILRILHSSQDVKDDLFFNLPKKQN
jgi:toxin ParE1/3/4